MTPQDTHLLIGSLVFDGMDQIDVTGPFEVFSRLPSSTYRLYGTTTSPVRDMHVGVITSSLGSHGGTVCAMPTADAVDPPDGAFRARIALTLWQLSNSPD